MLTLKLIVAENPTEIEYSTLEEILHDDGLRALFEQGLVAKCELYAGDRCITKLAFMTWARFLDQVISNSTTILRFQEKS